MCRLVGTAILPHDDIGKRTLLAAEDCAMYCRRCGAAVPEAQWQCGNCGEPVEGRHAQDYAAAGAPASHLVPAILVTIFCCMPFGVVAIVFAAISMSKAGSGDYAGALQAADQARTWCWVSFGLGLVAAVLYAAIFLLRALAS